MPISLKDRIENALVPRLTELETRLAELSLESVLFNYQWQLDLRMQKAEDLPDGFWAKWRYLWAVRLLFPIGGRRGSEADFDNIDQIVEDLFDMYSLAATYDPSSPGRDEKAFHFRLGLAIRVREVGELFFPEQHRERMKLRFKPFDEQFFKPKFGCTYDELIAWFEKLADALSKKADGAIEDLARIMEPVIALQAQVASGEVYIRDVMQAGATLDLEAKLKRNSDIFQQAHIFHEDELRLSLSSNSLQEVLRFFGASCPSSRSTDRLFPHSASPLAEAFLIQVHDGRWHFSNPSYALRNFEYVFEKHIFADSKLRDRYLRNRDRKTEESVVRVLRKLSATAEIVTNYYVKPGQNEKDILVRNGRKVLLIECKNSKIRKFSGLPSDALKFEDDFKKSVQLAYDQALEAKTLLTNKARVEFFDEHGRVCFFSVREDVDEAFIVCISDNPRGVLGTDLSFSLAKPEEEMYPLALREFDFETICGRMENLDQLFRYLDLRRRLHGRVTTGDELNFAGYYLRYGRLPLQKGTMVDDSFSRYFDDAWYADQGIPQDPHFEESPFESIIERKRNVVTHRNRKTGELMGSFVIPSNHFGYVPERKDDAKGRNRNQPCFCGSGKKYKKCHGLA